MKDLIKEARELCEKATPGPWKVKLHNEDYGQGYGETTFFVDIDGTLLKIDIADTAEKYAKYSALSTFIARSRSLIPELCDALEKSRWIPVTERLPDELETFIGRHKDGFIVLTVNSFDELEDVTHWMPLPQPPEGGAE